MPPYLVLCIPESYMPHIIYLYHDTIFAGHQGCDRTFYTIRKLFFFPNMLPCIHKYIQSCQVCQSRREKDPTTGIHYPRIPINLRPMSRMSMDVSHDAKYTWLLTHITMHM